MINETQLNQIQKVLQSNPQILSDLFNEDEGSREDFIYKTSEKHHLNLNSSQIQELAKCPSEIIDGMELPDLELNEVAGGGKGDATNYVGGDQTNSNVNIHGGNTNVGVSGSLNL